MTATRPAILIGTILLEKHRWVAGKVPTYHVSDWVDRFVEAGFEGMELWENHAALADDAELANLAASPLPVSVFNTYAPMDDAGADARRRAADLANQLGAQGVKFNVGHEPELEGEYVRNAAEWSQAFGDDFRMLCECHPGTVAETPDQAADIFGQWPDARFQAIVHPFGQSQDGLRAWFDALGDRITHAHVQMRGPDREVLRVASRAEHAAEQLDVMKGAGFAGTITLEFTEGTSTHEEIERLYDAALDDLAFIRAHL